MASNTPNLNLLKKDPVVDGNDTFNIETMLNENWDKVDNAVGNINEGIDKMGIEIDIMKSLVTTTGTSSAYIATVPGITNLAISTRVTLKFHIASTAPSTLNINGLGAKSITKPGGGSPNIKANGVYTLIYDGTSFQLQGEGGEYGTATQEDVKQGTTIGTENGVVAGTATDHGPGVASTTNLTTEGATYVIPKGFHSGLRTIKAVISGLVAGVIKAGSTVGGILGTFTSDATATAADILAPKDAYVNGNKVVGTIPVHPQNVHAVGNEFDAASGTAYIKPIKGYYGGSTWASMPVPNLIASNIKAGVQMGSGLTGVAPIPSGNAVASQVLYSVVFSNASGVGLAGTMPNRGILVPTISIQNGKYIIPEGYHSGAGVVTASFVNLVAGNVKDGVNIGGVVGTMKELRTFSSSFTLTNRNATVANIPFRPKFIFFMNPLNIAHSAAISDGTYIDATTYNSYSGKIEITNNGFIITGLNWIESGTLKYVAFY